MFENLNEKRKPAYWRRTFDKKIKNVKTGDGKQTRAHVFRRQIVARQNRTKRAAIKHDLRICDCLQVSKIFTVSVILIF